MGKIKHVINLTEHEKTFLLKVIEDPTSSDRQCKRARILLASDQRNSIGMTVENIAKEYQVTCPTVILTRKNYLKLGVEDAVKGKKREAPPIKPKVTDKIEAQIIHLLWSPPPPGRRRWTMRSLAQKVQEDGILESISRTKINKVLKKYGLVTKY